MAEFYRFFDSTLEDKRLYNADEFAEYFRRILTNGIFNGGMNLKVSTSGSDMAVDIADGFAWINGYLYKVEGGVQLQVEPAHPTLNRIDRVVIRWDKREEARYIKAFVIKGEASEEPAPPELTRTTDVYELSLAQVFVEAGKSYLPEGIVTDERLNIELCGLVNSLVQADTTEIFNQFQLYFNDKSTEYQTMWNTWFSENPLAYEKQWSDWFELNPPKYEEQWSDWFKTQTDEGKIPYSEKGAANGVATLDSNGKLSVDQFDHSVLVQLQKVNDKQNKEIAFLKLKQQASDRIEGGTTFADDMNGNTFGIEFDSELSENVVVKDGALTMNEGSFVDYSVDDSVVVKDSIYNTQGNGGRKLVRLDNDTLVCVVKTSAGYYVYKIIDNGRKWIQIYGSGFFSVQDASISTDGTYIFVLSCANNSTVACRVLNENGNVIETKTITSSQTELDICSLTINPEGTELHACWSGKNKTYPNSSNIQYCTGTIGEGGSVTWGNVEQITTLDSSGYYYRYPSIILNSNNLPVIVYMGYISSSTRNIYAHYYIGSTWIQKTVYSGQSYTQYYPSAIFVPKSVNGLENGRIWVAWQGTDSTYKLRHNIRVSYSDDNGQTWSTPERLTTGNTYDQYTPSITVNKNNEVFVVWHGNNQSSPTYYVISQIKWKAGTWGEAEIIKYGSTHVYAQSTLADVRLEFTKPLFVYTISNTSINFTGSWQVGVYTPTTEATAVYKLPSTDYVGLFVQKEGSVNITATINDIPMDSLLENNEYQFTKAVDNEEEVTLKLSLSRENTTNGDNDKITRMLGGRS